MKLSILSDAHVDSKVGSLVIAFAKLGYGTYFSEREYGEDLQQIVVGYICQNPELNLAPRIRFVKKEKTLYADIMLSLPEMKNASDARRKEIIASSLLLEMPRLLGKYRWDNFNSAQFLDDLKEWVEGSGWLRAN